MPLRAAGSVTTVRPTPKRAFVWRERLVPCSESESMGKHVQGWRALATCPTAAPGILQWDPRLCCGPTTSTARLPPARPPWGSRAPPSDGSPSRHSAERLSEDLPLTPYHFCQRHVDGSRCRTL